MMSLRSYAARRRCALSTVQTAIRSGRLRKALGTDAKGRIQIADPELADREWLANTDASHQRRGPSSVWHAEQPPGASQQRAEVLHGASGGPEDTTTPQRRPEVSPGVVPPTFQESKARHEAARATLAELELQERAGALVNAADVQAHVTGLIVLVRTKLLGVPSRIKQRRPDLNRDDISAIDDEIRAALEGLAQLGDGARRAAPKA